MTQVFRLPDLGEGLTEAEVVSWHVQVGDEVSIDQEVVTVETAKAAVDVPCPFAGTVVSLHAEPGTVLPVGEPLITVGAVDGAMSGMPSGGAADAPADHAGEQYRTEERAGAVVPQDAAGDAGIGEQGGTGDAPERPLIGYGAGDGPARRTTGGRRRRQPHAIPPPSAPDGGVSTPPSAPSGGPARSVRVISPLVRSLARDWGIDLATVRPGPTGVIRKADLEAARAQQPQHALGGSQEQPRETLGGVERQPLETLGEKGAQRIPIRGVQRIMVDRLTTSRREIPDATTWVDVDATGLMRAKDALRRARPEAGIGVLPLLARITVAGLTAYPALNSSVDTEAGEIVRHGEVNLGFAAQSPRGLVVPVVHGAHAMTTAELAAALRELTEKARDGRVSPAELTGGTVTLNNYGVFGVDGSTPIINHPEAAMLGVGRIVDKPWVHKGKVKVRKVTQLSFTFDHRVCDGGTAGGFLRFVADCVEDPAALLADV